MAAAAAAAVVLLTHILLGSTLSAVVSTDAQAFLQLRESLAPTDELESWLVPTPPCDPKALWYGVICGSGDGDVVGLHLSGLHLSGKIDADALTQIPSLRTLSFVNNSFSGPIPAFNRIPSLRSLLLSTNNFSGQIPDDYFNSLSSLRKLWLSANKFSGPIPTSLAKLPHLAELHLEANQFSGPIPALPQSSLNSLDMSLNNLTGEIPPGLARFAAKPFQGNAGLCGEQLGRACASAVPAADPRETASSADAAAETPPHSTGGGLKSTILAVLILALFAIMVMFGILSAASYRNKQREFDTLARDTLAEEVQVAAAARDRAAKATGRKGKSGTGDLVMVNGRRGEFGMSDLMTAAAEMLGNGALGSAYKAVMEDGVSVVVKRIREMNKVGRDGFDAEIRRLGRLCHRNILTPLAYHYRKEEKLLVSEFVPKGSLLYVLHGNRGLCHAELNWSTRLKIVKGIASGMGFLHSEFPSQELPHGNLKSCNVLLDSDYEPLLSDYAFYPLMNAPQSMFAFKSPEVVAAEAAEQQAAAVSRKCDVYCMGVIVLELLTGKFPAQYMSSNKRGTDVVEWARSAMRERRAAAELIDPELVSSAPNSVDQMEALLRVGLGCSESDPVNRLDMREAIRRIDEIRER